MYYLIQFRMKFICRYLIVNNALIVPDVCKTWDYKTRNPLLVYPFCLYPRVCFLFFSLNCCSVSFAVSLNRQKVLVPDSSEWRLLCDSGIR